MSKESFKFGTPSAVGSSGQFGQPGQPSEAAPSKSLFTTTNKPSGIFGVPASTTVPSIFGTSATSNAGSVKPAPSLFSTSGGNTGAGQAASLFGGGGTTTGGANAFSGFNFGKKADEKKETSFPTTSAFSTADKSAPTSQGQQANIFAASDFSTNPSTSAAPTLTFGAATSSLASPATSSAAPAGSITPATTKPGGIFQFANSTTPAGPPPAESSNTSTKAGGGPLFGSTMSSGGIFGAQNASSPTNNTTSQPPSLFGRMATSSPATNLFATKTANQSTTGTATPAATSTAGTAVPVTTAFNLPSPAPAPTSSTAPKGPNMFGGVATTAPIISPTTATAQTTSILGATTTASPANAAPAQSPSLFTLGNPTGATTSSSVPTGTSAPTHPPVTFTLKPSAAGSETTSTSKAPDVTGANTEASASVTEASNSNPLGASTVGPPPQYSRLKNKTMDEIISRWATDLSTYQKEFQSQATKVSAWDRLLVDNGDKIQKLYTSTFEAERASAEVERQLVHVESQQEELTAWLDHYEREINDMFVKQVGPGESLQGPDQERERTYKLAEKLTDKLDEMGKDLTSMIQEINAASASLTKTSKADDPLSQIVKVLNGHLSQLQWIDQNASALQTKVAAAQKASQSFSSNGFANPDNETADEFYRSYMGKR